MPGDQSYDDTPSYSTPVLCRSAATTLTSLNLSGNSIAEEDYEEGAAKAPTLAGAVPLAGSFPPGAQQQTIEIGSPFSVPFDDPTATLHPSPMSNQNLGQVMHLTASNVTSLTGCEAPPCCSPDEVTMAKLHQAARKEEDQRSTSGLPSLKRVLRINRDEQLLG
jgi:hypothetical protein